MPSKPKWLNNRLMLTSIVHGKMVVSTLRKCPTMPVSRFKWNDQLEPSLSLSSICVQLLFGTSAIGTSLFSILFPIAGQSNATSPVTVRCTNDVWHCHCHTFCSLLFTKHMDGYKSHWRHPRCRETRGSIVLSYQMNWPQTGRVTPLQRRRSRSSFNCYLWLFMNSANIRSNLNNANRLWELELDRYDSWVTTQTLRKRSLFGWTWKAKSIRSFTPWDDPIVLRA